MDVEPLGLPSRRKRRALALIGGAAAVTLAAGLLYVLPSGSLGGLGLKQPTLATFEHIGYYFVTPSLGWAVESPTPDGGLAIFKTTDGAQHWRKQMATDSSVVGFSDLSVQFPDQHHGYIAVGGVSRRLLRTSDGGTNWQSVPLPDAISRVDAIAFAGPGSGWLLAAGQPSRLYATNDGGATWLRLPDPPPDADNISFRGSGEAWMGSAAVGPPHVYESADTGRSWKRYELPPPSSREWTGREWEGGVPADVELLPGDGVHVFLPPVARPGLVELGYSLTLTSFDQGRTWSYVPTPPGVLGYQDSKRWWAMSRTDLYKSPDAGQTWSQSSDRLPAWQYVPHVLDPRHAWAAIVVRDGNGLALTEDGGLHWTRGTVPSA